MYAVICFIANKHNILLKEKLMQQNRSIHHSPGRK